MRRLELSDDEHQALLEVVRRQHRQTLDPALLELHRTVANAPRVIAYCVSVEVPQPPPVRVGPGAESELVPSVHAPATAVAR